MAEMLDIYDENLTHLGVKSREDVHRDGDWHKVFHCWVIYRDDDGQDWIIVQKRAPDKQTYPNMLDVSAAGHYEAGETPLEGMRELEEELGLFPEFDDLIYAGRRMTAARFDGLIDREVADIYLYICNQPLSSYNFQKEELSGLIAVNVAEGLRLFTGEVESIESPASGFASDTVSVKKEHFISVYDHYWEKIFLLTTRCLNGEKHLFI